MVKSPGNTISMEILSFQIAIAGNGFLTCVNTALSIFV
jgi:hypothetical protein